MRAGTLDATGGEQAPERRARQPVPSVQTAVLAVPVVILALGGWAYRYISDDGFINLRVTSQLTHGNGPVFNMGERVEAVTSPLWVAVLAVADVVTPVRLEWIAVLLGIALTLWGLVAAIGAARLLAATARPGAMVVPAGALVYAVLPPAWEYSTSALEGGLDRAWLGSVAFLLARTSRSNRSDWMDHYGLALLVGLGPLIRPDFALFWLVLVVAALACADGRGLGRRARWLLAAAAPPVVLELFRVGYYGALLPNTAYAKEAGSPRIGRGWEYLTDFLGPYWLWVPLLLLAVGALVPLLGDLVRVRARRDLALVVALVAGGLLHWAYVVAIGGDFMHARMLMPGLFALLVPVAVVPLERSRALVAATVPWAVVSLAFLRFSMPDVPVPLTGSPRALAMAMSGSEHPVTTDDWRKNAPPLNRALLDGTPGVYQGDRPLVGPDGPLRTAPGGPSVVVIGHAVGLTSYELPREAYILDGLGLGDAFAAHLELERRGLPGHEKALPPAWIWARFVDPDVPVVAGPVSVPDLIASRTGTNIEQQSDDELAEDVAVARQALTCTSVDRLLQATREPLTLGRVVDNFRDAVRLNDLRIPSDPDDAVSSLC